MATPDYRPRSGWTSTSRGGALLDGRELVWLVDHYTGAPTTYGRMSVAAEAAALRSIRDYHMRVRGWADIGYQACVTQAGRVWDLRGISRVPVAHGTSATPRANHMGGALLWLLGANEAPTDDMIAAARHFRHEVWLKRWPHAAKRIGHRQVPGASTTCPGQPVARLLADGTLLLPMEDDMATPEQNARATWQRRWTDPVTGTERTYSQMLRSIREDTDQLDRIAEQQAAIQAAVSGQDVAAAIEAHAAEARAHRNQIAANLADRLAAAQGELEEILALVQQVGSGELAADEVVDELARRLAPAESTADGE